MDKHLRHRTIRGILTNENLKLLDEIFELKHQLKQQRVMNMRMVVTLMSDKLTEKRTRHKIAETIDFATRTRAQIEKDYSHDLIMLGGQLNAVLKEHERLLHCLGMFEEDTTKKNDSSEEEDEYIPVIDRIRMKLMK